MEVNAHLPCRVADIVCSYTVAQPMIIRYIVPPDVFVVLPFVLQSVYVYDCTIDWGDGGAPQVHGPDATRRPTHVYTTPGRSVTIRISGGARCCTGLGLQHPAGHTRPTIYLPRGARLPGVDRVG